MSLFDYEELGRQLRQIYERATPISEVRRSVEFSKRCSPFYESSDDDGDDLASDLTARFDAQTLRLALIFALADGVAILTKEHFEAATACWRFLEASTRYIFGNRLGDPDAQKMLEAARVAYPEGLDGTAQDRILNGRNVKPVCERLVKLGLLREEAIKTGSSGRPGVTVYAVPYMESGGINSLNGTIQSESVQDSKSVYSAAEPMMPHLQSLSREGEAVLRF